MRDSSAMDAKTHQAFDARYPIAFGAGLAAALLCLVVRQGTLPAYFLAYFAPLPIMIATLGFGILPGLTAATIGTVTIIAYFAARPTDFWAMQLISAAFYGGVFAVTMGLPAWWLARLMRLQRTNGHWQDGAQIEAAKFEPRICYPLDRLLAFSVLAAFVVMTLVVVALVVDEGGFERLVDRFAAKAAPFVLDMVGTREMPQGVDLQDLSRLYVKLLPGVATYIYLLLIIANLWLAGRVVQVSNLLVRPWPDIAQDLRLPRAFALIFLASAAIALLGGLAGMIAACAATACGLGFMLQGLAVIHTLTRELRYRGALLAAIYAAVAILPPMVLPLTAIGLLDAALAFRTRKIFAAQKT
jgi:hypothetical protein